MWYFLGSDFAFNCRPVFSCMAIKLFNILVLQRSRETGIIMRFPIFLHKSFCYNVSFKPSLQDCSFKRSQHRFLLRNKKNYP